MIEVGVLEQRLLTFQGLRASQVRKWSSSVSTEGFGLEQIGGYYIRLFRA